MRKYLIINADDFGMCHSANMAVLDLFQSGCIHSTTLMACCPWAKEAAALCHQHPEIHVGLHVTHTAEWENYRWGPMSSQAASLRDEEGYFFHRTEDVLYQANSEDLMREMQAQVQWLRKQEIPFTHLDNHMLTLQNHLIETLKYCQEEGFSFRLARAKDQTHPQTAAAIAYADTHGIAIIDYLNPNSDRFPNDRYTYASIRDSYLAMLAHLPEGASEFFTHPAVESEELKAIAPDWRVRVGDYQFLKDPVFRQSLRDNQITLIGWEDAALLNSASALRK